MNPDASGRVKFKDFLRAFRLRTCTLSEEVSCTKSYLDSLMQRRMDQLHSSSSLYGSAHVMKQPLFQQSCELAFAQCDTSGCNQISEQELGDTIRLAIPDYDEDEYI
uniref:EF-hand domain-containing protein n=1 Tax=Salix viminalis TaxID=40686 RepID=A0A6N2MSE3_SALVM